ncbi:MAG TPA: hypothetical protein VFF67_04100 [Thermoplasmata archaeon]|nr:hypothetical protein [Thermoplasmata archaeon]
MGRNRTPEADPHTAWPVCGRQGTRVIELTVTAHLRAEFWNALVDGFWFRWTPECPIRYFDNARETFVSKDLREVRSRFGLKARGAPRPICCYLGVNAERIFEEVDNKGCCDSLEDVERHTRAGTGKWCVITNPYGVCCRTYLKDVVAESLERASPGSRTLVTAEAEKLKADDAPGVALGPKVGGMDCESCGGAVTGLLEHDRGRTSGSRYPTIGPK